VFDTAPAPLRAAVEGQGGGEVRGGGWVRFFVFLATGGGGFGGGRDAQIELVPPLPMPPVDRDPVCVFVVGFRVPPAAARERGEGGGGGGSGQTGREAPSRARAPPPPALTKREGREKRGGEKGEACTGGCHRVGRAEGKGSSGARMRKKIRQRAVALLFFFRSLSKGGGGRLWWSGGPAAHDGAREGGGEAMSP
jgi:hypothetical protein